MTTRETNTITLPTTKKEVIFYTYITAKENREWFKILSQKEKPDYSTIIEGQDFIFKTLVTSFDGDSDNIVERMGDLPKTDFKFIDDLLAKVISDDDFLDKEKN